MTVLFVILYNYEKVGKRNSSSKLLKLFYLQLFVIFPFLWALALIITVYVGILFSLLRISVHNHHKYYHSIPNYATAYRYMTGI